MIRRIRWGFLLPYLIGLMVGQLYINDFDFKKSFIITGLSCVITIPLMALMGRLFEGRWSFCFIERPIYDELIALINKDK